jgi:hypothetical protein
LQLLVHWLNKLAANSAFMDVITKSVRAGVTAMIHARQKAKALAIIVAGSC